LREKVNVFYYPSMVADSATLKKSILLFDELHFIDRPSFTFKKFGTIATASPLRAYEESFRTEGVQLYVHGPHDGPVQGEFLEQVTSDVNDVEFLRRFQKGLEESAAFRSQQIAPGNYGEVGNQDDVARELGRVNLDADMKQYAKPMDLFSDEGVQHFRFKTEEERAKGLVTNALTCSAMVNFALNVGQRQGITPLADAVPYQGLLGAKYARAARALENTDSRIQLTDLSFAIFDEVVPAMRLEKLSFKDIVTYRKETEMAREAFLEHLIALQTKQGRVNREGDYSGAINDIVVTEIIPEARKFKSQIDRVYDKLFGSLATSSISFLGGGAAALQILGDLSWPNLLRLAGLTGAAIGKAAIEAKLEVRAAHRDCAISYILGLDRQ
jgi:hypothetical protein